MINRCVCKNVSLLFPCHVTILKSLLVLLRCICHTSSIPLVSKSQLQYPRKLQACKQFLRHHHPPAGSLPLSTMTPLNPSLYNWTSPLPGIYRRPALSTEALWSTRPKELHEIFVTAKLTFSTPSTRVALRTAAVRAWRLLRFEVPELGLNVAVQDGEIFLEYRVIGEEGISDWMSRTFFFNNAGEGGKYGFEGLRGDICSRKEGEDMAGVLLDFNGLREEWNGDLGLIDSMYVILNVDHQVSDGIGTRILMGRFLDLFAWCVGDGVEDENLLVWEESGKNLSKPWIGMLDGKQKLEGGGFEEVAEKKKIYLYHEIVFTTPPSRLFFSDQKSILLEFQPSFCTGRKLLTTKPPF